MTIKINVDEFLEISYLNEKISTNDVKIKSNKSYNEYEVQNKKYIFDPQETGNYTIAYDNNSISVSVSDTPESVIAQYDFREENGNLPVTDQSNSGNDLDSGSYSGVGRNINGHQAGDFSGSDSIYTSTLNENPGTGDATIYVVLIEDNNNEGSVVSATDGSGNRYEIFKFSGQRRINLGPSTYGGPSVVTGSPVILTLETSNGTLRSNGNQIVNGASPTVALDQFEIGGSKYASAGGTSAAVGFVEIHNGDPSSGVISREQEIANDWGITL